MTQIKTWTDGVQVEQKAMEQLKNVASLPFVHHHVAGMPDMHWGMGATVGSVIPTKGAIIPAAVGVDIGCGMAAAMTSITADRLPDNLHNLRCRFEAVVPHGRTDDGGVNDKGAFADPRTDIPSGLLQRLGHLVDKHPAIGRAALRAPYQIGTLGTGNHFIELCVDTEDAVWVVLHSGSRGIGNRIGTHFIELAKQDMRKWFINLPDKDLAYFVEGTENFDDYVSAVGWAQDFALANRRMMMDRLLGVLKDEFEGLHILGSVVECHHNYVEKENHYGENVWVTRKGALRARQTDIGIIPGSMGASTFIVRGKGNAESFNSCSHGAGRSMSRGAAKKQITLEDHVAATEGIECRKDVGVLDESPAAYKPINAVMAAQGSLVTVITELKQVINVKG